MLARLALVLAAAAPVLGCLTSPYYAQTFDERWGQVPFQVWTVDKTQSVTLECAPASAHGGPYDGEGSYQFLATLTVSPREHYDYKGGYVYQASGKVVIPDACWRGYSYPDGANFITVVRITQGSNGDNAIFTYDKAGLECFGARVGEHGIGGGTAGNCHKKYINTGGPIKTVFLRAKT
jgi:hypothetical protein